LLTLKSQWQLLQYKNVNKLHCSSKYTRTQTEIKWTLNKLLLYPARLLQQWFQVKTIRNHHGYKIIHEYSTILHQHDHESRQIEVSNQRQHKQDTQWHHWIIQTASYRNQSRFCHKIKYFVKRAVLIWAWFRSNSNGARYNKKCKNTLISNAVRKLKQF
jgi:hypothetical protein